MRSMKKLKKAKATNEQHNFTKHHTSNMNVTTEEADEEEEERADDAKQLRLRDQVVRNIRKDPSVTANSLKKWITADLKGISK